MAFIDTQTRPAGEAQQKVGRIKLSEAIRIGCRDTTERRTGFWNGEDGACAIGAAWFAMSGGRSYPNLDEMARLLNIEVDDILRASAEHHRTNKSREQVADWLAAQGL